MWNVGRTWWRRLFYCSNGFLGWLGLVSRLAFIVLEELGKDSSKENLV